MRGMSAPHVVMSVITYISTFVNLCMHITRCYRLTHIIIEAYIHVYYDYVFIKNIYDKECLMYIKYANNNCSSRNSQYRPT